MTTDSKHDLPIAENLLARDFTPAPPDRDWSRDITYIATDEGSLYLAAMTDLIGDHAPTKSLWESLKVGDCMARSSPPSARRRMK
jgi:transposase InsO family protein